MTKAKDDIIAYWMRYEGNPWWEKLKTNVKELYGWSIYALFSKAKTSVMLDFIRYWENKNGISALGEIYDFVDYLAEEGNHAI